MEAVSKGWGARALACVTALVAALTTVPASAQNSSVPRILYSFEGLQLMEPDGTGVYDIPGTEDAHGPAEWAPDGSLIALYDGDGDPATIEPDGENLRKLTGGAFDPWSASSFTWSPDSSRLALVKVIAGRARILVVEVGSPEERLELQGGSPSWSPDSTELVYQNNAGDRVKLTNVETGDTHVLGPGHSPHWSPTNDSIAYITKKTLHVITGSSDQALSGVRARSPVWSPDGEKIAFLPADDWKGGVVLASADLSDAFKPFPYAIDLYGGLDPNTLWSPDSKFLLVRACKRRFGYCDFSDLLYVSKADGSGGQWVSNDASGGVDWSPDGRRLVTTDYGELSTLNRDGTGWLNLQNKGYFPSWQPCQVECDLGFLPGSNTHDRRVDSYVYDYGETWEFTGYLNSRDHFMECEAWVPAHLQQRRNGAWRNITTVTTTSEGYFTTQVQATKRPLRAKAIEVEVGEKLEHTCKRAHSKPFRSDS